ncbi:MAG: GNAT family N-acetyltransferase [Thiohalomonadaceae bacterium]
MATERAEAGIESVDEVARVARQWEELEPWCDATVFQSSTWVVPWLREALARFDVRLVRAEHGGMPIGLGLLVRRRIRRRFVVVTALFVNETGPSDIDFCVEHNGFLLRRGYEQEATRAILRCLQQSHDWDELHLRRCAGKGFSAGGTEGSGLRLRKPDTTVAPFVDLDRVRAAADDYLACLSANRRSQLRRAMRLLEREGPVEVCVAQTHDEAMGFFDGLKELHQKHWQTRGEPGAFANPRWEAFHRRLIAEGLACGNVQLLRVTAGERVVGYIHSLVRDGHVYMIQSGINYDMDGKIHPGEVCHVMAINWNARAGHRVYDFLGGDMRYKRSLATGMVEMDNLVLQRPRLRFLLEDVLRTLRDKALNAWARAGEQAGGLRRGGLR